MAKQAGDSSAPPPRVRRTQRERSDAMRTRLLEATIDSLYEVGYSKTTTIEVAARAGVSRGAQLHHFPTKKRLVTIAVRHLLAKRVEEFREAFAQLPEGADRYTAVIDILWEKTSNRAFYAWLELVVAARTDASLRKTLTEIAEQFSEQVQQTFREFFASQRQHSSPIDIAPVFSIAVMQGLAINRIVWPEGDRRQELVLQALKGLAAMTIRALQPPRSAPPPAAQHPAPPDPEPTKDPHPKDPHAKDPRPEDPQ